MAFSNAGRSAIIAWFAEVLDRFDRRFESRTLTLLDGPSQKGDTVQIGGYATYTAEGIPDFDLHLTESIRFRDGLIVHLEDRYEPEMVDKTIAHMLRYGKALGLEDPGHAAD